MIAPDLASTLSTLVAAVPVSVTDASRAPEDGGLPAAPGVYAWWVTQGALTLTNGPAHPTQTGWSLLYIGVAPASEASKRQLRSRVLGNHVRGNTGSSTFRYSLASLLIDELGLHPVRRRNKVVLNAADNRQLTAWQEANLGVTWTSVDAPWILESDVIQHLGPPLNLAGNAAHGFHAQLTAARADFRSSASDGDHS